MRIDSTNLFLSLAILQKQRVARDKMFAASVSAALVPGLMGLVIPLVVARNDGSSTSDTGTDTVTLTTLPRVVGKTEQEAVTILKDSELTPVVKTAIFLPSTTTTKGTVVTQDPDPDPSEKEWVPVNTEVTITVSSGARTDGPPDDTTIDEQIREDVEQLKVDMVKTQNQIEDSKEEILKAIAAK